MSPLEVHPFLFTQDHIIFEQRKHDYEVMRLQAYHLARLQIDLAKAGIKGPSDLIPFVWDKEVTKVIDLNPEDYTEDAFLLAEKRYGIGNG